MFTNFTSYDDQVLKQHHKELAAAVARERLARLATAGQPTVLDKAVGGVGVALELLGQRLQSRSAAGKCKQVTALKRA